MENNIEYPKYVMCPLVDEEIDAGGCIEVSDCARGLFKEIAIEKRFTKYDQWRKICESCVNRKYTD